MSLIDLASLVLAPTATKEGKVYSAIPDTGDGDMTFTRGSSATRVNSAGLIEKERGNLLLQSNAFDTTWTNVNSTETSGQSGYDGSSDAWLLASTGTNARLVQSISQTGVQTFSIYAKKGSLDFIRVFARDVSNINPSTYFNLSNGTIGSQNDVISATIKNVGNGWYRCEIVFTKTISDVRIYTAQADGDLTATSGNIYIQDAMLNEGLVAQPYIETTTTAVYEGITDDVPRVDYSGGGCPSLLLEGQRTNLVTNSEYIASITDLTNGDGTITSTSNYAISPEGVKNATRIQASATGSNYAVKSYTAPSSVSGNYTCSMYIKSNTSSNQSINFYARGGNNVITVTPEWQRFVVVGVGSTNFINFGILSSGQENIDILCYGLQMEQDVTYPTSYIPTYGTSTSRSADSCSLTNASNLIGQSEGTLFCEVDFQQTESSSRFIAVGDGTSANRIAVFTNSSNDGFRVFVADNSNIQVDSSIAVSKGIVKLALAYANNDYVLYVNGVSRITDTNASVPACDNVYLGRQEISLTNVLGSGINQAILFPTRLTNDQLQELTK